MEMPKRLPTMKVEMVEGVTAILRTMTSRELAAVWERSAPEVVVPKAGEEGVRNDSVTLRASLQEMVVAFESHLLGFEGSDVPTFDGAPFVAGDADHLARLKPGWKVKGGNELITDAMLAGTSRGN
jgi:hypothetical protein